MVLQRESLMPPGFWTLLADGIYRDMDIYQYDGILLGSVQIQSKRAVLLSYVM